MNNATKSQSSSAALASIGEMASLRMPASVLASIGEMASLRMPASVLASIGEMASLRMPASVLASIGEMASLRMPASALASIGEMASLRMPASALASIGEMASLRMPASALSAISKMGLLHTSSDAFEAIGRAVEDLEGDTSEGDAESENERGIQEGPTLVVQGVVEEYGQTKDGALIRVVAPIWENVVRHLQRDWRLALEISPRAWEEMVAGAFERSGYDEVILTPRSGDYGRDVIAIRHGVCCVRIIGSVKAYKPGHLVKHDDVRALAGVLHGDPSATKGIVTTTSDFAPGISKDPFLSPLMPYRLELMNGTALKDWLATPLDL